MAKYHLEESITIYQMQNAIRNQFRSRIFQYRLVEAVIIDILAIINRFCTYDWSNWIVMSRILFFDSISGYFEPDCHPSLHLDKRNRVIMKMHK